VQATLNQPRANKILARVHYVTCQASLILIPRVISSPCQQTILGCLRQSTNIRTQTPYFRLSTYSTPTSPTRSSTANMTDWTKKKYNEYYTSYMPWIEDKVLGHWGENKTSYTVKGSPSHILLAQAGLTSSLQTRCPQT